MTEEKRIYQYHPPAHRDVMPKLAKFMKEKRAAMGLTLRDLSQKIYGPGKVNMNAYLSAVENGRRKSINIDTMQKILTALEADIQGFEEFNY